MEVTRYGLRIRLNVPYEEAVDKVTAALKEQGFGILTTIDVKETLKKKLDVDFRKYIILGACNPPLAHRALTAEQEIGLLLPCNVIVYEENGHSVVAVADPIAMMQIVGNPELDAVAQEARTRLERALQQLAGELVAQ